MRANKVVLNVRLSNEEADVLRAVANQQTAETRGMSSLAAAVRSLIREHIRRGETAIRGAHANDSHTV